MVACVCGRRKKGKGRCTIRTVQSLCSILTKVPNNAMLEGKSMPCNMVANTNHTTLLKNQSIIKYLP